jgi:ribose transport system substrate-binding protein
MKPAINTLFTRRQFTATGAKLAAAAAVIALSATGCSSASTDSTAAAAPAAKAENVVLVESVRSLSNPYHANWVKGGQMFADSMGMPVKVVTDDGDSQKQLSQIRSLANAGKKIILNVDPNTSSDTQAIVRAVKDAGGFVVTQWNKPDELNPWDVGDSWVAHIGFDGRVSGKQVAEKLFDAMGGSGGIIALQGILDNVSAKQRFEGLQTAMKSAPGIELLDQQTASWNRNTAFQVTQTLLAKHGGKVKGVWAANDDMALGALQALKAAGLAGKVPIVGIDAVPEALSEVQSGANKYVATVSSDAFWQGGAALALAYKAATGAIDIKKLNHDQRAFYGTQILITSANVAEHLAAPTAESLKQDFDDPFRRMTAPIN